MPGFIRFFQCAQRSASGFFAFLITAAMVCFSIAPACAGQVATRVLPVSGAPVQLLSCRYNSGPYYPGDRVLNVSFANLSSHVLFSASVRVQVYDVEGSLIGSNVIQIYNDSSHPVEPHDTQTGSNPDGMGNGISEPPSVVRNATCRIEHAEFIGHRTWSYGSRWPEHVTPISETSGYVSPDNPQQPPSPRSDIRLSVTNAWNDTLQGALFVHAALDIRGGNVDATLTPQMLSLTMQLANGSKKTYGAMTQAAPTYQKLNPLGQNTTTAYEVDPKDDLGGIGSVIIPAHGDVHIVATFFIGNDVLADPNANRQVSLQ